MRQPQAPATAFPAVAIMIAPIMLPTPLGWIPWWSAFGVPLDRDTRYER